jgi:Relaxase/Mobilisation nuclease domain
MSIVVINDQGPEVVIKVVSPGSNNLKAIRYHLEMLQDGKERVLEMDLRAAPVRSKKAAAEIIKEWGLDSDERLYRHLKPVRSVPRKIVHKIIFSMPAGTPPQGLLSAVRSFAREEFGQEHRYALALHTDEPHPHVHMIIRAMKEGQLVRLNIRKPLLHRWRQEFARHLCIQGVPAKATSRKERRELFPAAVRRSFKRPIRSGALQSRK